MYDTATNYLLPLLYVEAALRNPKLHPDLRAVYRETHHDLVLLYGAYAGFEATRAIEA